MKIAIYALCYNESYMLPFFYMHYRNLADRIVIYDNESTDGSAELAACFGFEVRSFSTQGEYREDVMTRIRNTCWQELRNEDYDWIFVLDIDELLYHVDLLNYLSACKQQGVTICIPQGYNMIGTSMPIHDSSIVTQITRGTPDMAYSKPVVFNPAAIRSMNLSPGSHFARPTGNAVVNASGNLKLLHFHWLTLQSVIDKNKWRSVRRSKLSRKIGWGAQYSDTPERVTEVYNTSLANAVNAIAHDTTDKASIAKRMARLLFSPTEKYPRKPQ